MLGRVLQFFELIKKMEGYMLPQDRQVKEKVSVSGHGGIGSHKVCWGGSWIILGWGLV